MYTHPGGFYIFSGRADHFGPDYLLDHDVVLVTFNYRLGFAGFAGGQNAALKDQALVLRWIEQNIGRFGGDARCVTLMGSSAGAMSVVLQLVAAAAANDIVPFHRMIVMIGGVIPQLPLPQVEPIELLRRQVRLLRCDYQPATRGNENEMSTLLDCVRRANETELAQSVYKMFEFGRDNPIFLWLPIVEQQSDRNNITDAKDERFLRTSYPLEKIRGHVARIPILCGTTADELSTSAFQILADAEQTAAWQTEFARVAPICLHYERDTNRSATISARIWAHYFERDAPLLRFERLSQCFSDAIINFPVDRLADLAAEQMADVYRYKFTYRGAYTNFPHAQRRPRIVEHCDDLRYLFTSKLWPRIRPGDRDAAVVRRLTKMVVSFAKNG